jgi:hypothetical protein
VRRRRSGNSLLELAAASAIIATAMVPALRLFAEGIRISREIESVNASTTFCAGKLEEELARTNVAWAPGSAAGDFAAQGRPELRFAVTRSDAAADGGLPGRLMAMTVSVWNDRDADGAQDAGEPVVRLATKMAMITSLQYETAGN